MDYTGGFQLAVDVYLLFNKSAYLSVTVKKMKGRARMQFTRMPYTHWSFSFYEVHCFSFICSSVSFLINLFCLFFVYLTYSMFIFSPVYQLQMYGYKIKTPVMHYIGSVPLGHNFRVENHCPLTNNIAYKQM